MKVSELIDLLSELDPDKSVTVYDREGYFCQPDLSIRHNEEQDYVLTAGDEAE